MSDIYVPSPGTFAGYGQTQTYQGGLTDVQYNEDLNNRIKLLAKFPMFAADPRLMEQLALSEIPTVDLVRQGIAAFGAMNADRLAQNLSGMSEDSQRRVWSQLTDFQRAAVGQSGYKAPDTGGGFAAWSGPLSFVGDAAATGLRVANSVLTAPGVKQGLDILIWLADQPEHFYRTLRTMEHSNPLIAGLGAVAGAGIAVAGVAAAAPTGGLSLTATLGVLGGGALLGASAASAGYAGAVHHSNDWWNAFKDTWEGEEVFTRGARRRAAEILQSDRLVAVAHDLAFTGDIGGLALDLAGNMDATNPGVIMRSVTKYVDEMIDQSDPKHREIVQQLLELVRQPEFAEAMRVLQEGKISVGRDFARALGMSPGDQFYGLVSGATDAVRAIVLDPTMAVGKLAVMNRMRVFGLKVVEGTAAVDTVKLIAQKAERYPQIGQAFDNVALAVNAEQHTMLMTRGGVFASSWDALLAKSRELKAAGHGEFTRDDLFEWLTEGENLGLMMRGDGIRKGYSQYLMPRYGFAIRGHLLQTPRAFEWAKATIDLMDDARSAAALRRAPGTHTGWRSALRKMAEEDREAIVTAGDIQTIRDKTNLPGFKIQELRDSYETTAKVIDFLDSNPLSKATGITFAMRQFGALGGALTTMLPQRTGIRLYGLGSGDDVHRFVEMGRIVGMSSSQRAMFQNAIMGTTNLAERRRIAISFLDGMLTSAGLRTFEAGNELVDTFVNQIKQRYAAMPGGFTQYGDTMVPRAMNVSHQAVEIPFPNLRELQTAARKGVVLQYMTSLTNTNIHDIILNKMWKPAVLLRIGFIPRAVGEEVLSFLAREGLGAYLAQFGIRSIAQGELYDEFMAEARAGKVLTSGEKRLDEAGIHKLARMKYVAHVRPFEHTWNWLRHNESTITGLDRWSRFVRTELKGGVLGREWLDRVPDKIRTAVAGRPGGFRRLVLAGVTDDDLAFFKLYEGRFSDAIMKELSARNANVWEDVRRLERSETAMFRNPANGDREEVANLDWSHWILYRGNTNAPRMAYRQTHDEFADPVQGPAKAQVVGWSPPTANLRARTDEELDSLYDAWRSTTSHDDDLERLFHEVASPRGLWDPMKRSFTGKRIYDMIEGAFDDRPSLARFGEWVYNNRRFFQLSDESATKMRRLLDELEGMTETERIWLTKHWQMRAAGPGPDDWIVGGGGVRPEPELPPLGDLTPALTAELKRLDGDLGLFDEAVASNGIHPDAPVMPHTPIVEAYTSDLAAARLEHRLFERELTEHVTTSATELSPPRYPDEFAETRAELEGVREEMRAVAVRLATDDLDPDLADALQEQYGDLADRAAGLTDEMSMYEPQPEDVLLEVHPEAPYPPGYLDPVAADLRLQEVWPEIKQHIDRAAAPGLLTPVDDGLPPVSRPRTADMAMLGRLFGTPDNVVDELAARTDDLLDRLRYIEGDNSGNWWDTGGSGTTWDFEGTAAHAREKIRIRIEEFNNRPLSQLPSEAELVDLEQRVVALEEAGRMAAAHSGLFQGDPNIYTRDDWEEALEVRDRQYDEGVHYENNEQWAGSDPFLTHDQIVRFRAEWTELQRRDLETAVSSAESGLSEALDEWRFEDEVARRQWTVERWNDLQEQRAAVALQRDAQTPRSIEEFDAAVDDLDRRLLTAADDERDDLVALREQTLRHKHIAHPSTAPAGTPSAPAPPLPPNGPPLVGFGANGNNSPFPTRYLRTRAEQDEAMSKMLLHAHMQPENQYALSGMDYQIQTSNGTGVVNPYQRLGTSTYVATTSPATAEELIHALQTYGPQEVARSLKAAIADTGRWTDEEAQLIAQVGPDVIDEFVDRLARHGAAGWRTSLNQLAATDGIGVLPLAVMAFDDPMTARMMSRVVEEAISGGTLPDAVLAIGEVVGPAKLAAFTPVAAGPFHRPMVTRRGGHAWALDTEQVAPLVTIPQGGIIARADGSHVVGTTLEDALTEHVGYAVTNFAAVTRPAAVREYVAMSGGYSWGQMGSRPINPGDRVPHATTIYTPDNRPIRVSDAHDAFEGAVALDDSPDFLDGVYAAWADSVDEHLGRMMFHGDERVIPGLTPDEQQRRLATPHERAWRSDWTDWEDTELPAQIYGPRLIFDDPKMLMTRLFNKGFDKVISPALDAAVRTPMAAHYFVEAMRTNKQFYLWMRNPDIWQKSLPEQFQSVIDRARLDVPVAELAADLRRVMPRLDRTLVDMANDIPDDELVRWAHGYFVKDPNAAQNLEKLKNARVKGASALSRYPWWGVPLRDHGDDVFGGLVHMYEDALGWKLARGTRLDATKEITALPADLRDVIFDDTWATLQAASKNLKHAEQVAIEYASQRAIVNGLQYIDSHEIRSQFGEYMKAYAPFWYAEENFLKRWARTLMVNPAALRKGQLLYSGLKSGGVIRTDESGQDWFVYPGMGLAAEVLGKTPVFGDVLPAGVVFAARPESMLPGFDLEQTGIPQGSPFVALTIQQVTNFFPELRTLEQAVAGQPASDAYGVSLFVPTWARRTWDALTKDEDTSRRYASAMMSTMQVLEATGHGLPDNATLEDLQDWQDRVRASTRTVLMAQAIGGFIVPGAPQIQYTGESNTQLDHLTGIGLDRIPDEARSYWLSLVYELGIEEATIQFIKTNPYSMIDELVNPLAFTTSMTETPSGAPLPATAVGLRFYENNRRFMEVYPIGGPWLFPPDPEARNSFDHFAYQEQLAVDLRRLRTPAEFAQQMRFKAGATAYFEKRDIYEAARLEHANLGHTRAVQELDARWQRWATEFKAMHPLFTDQLESSDSRQRRERALDQLRLAMMDPLLPDTPHTTNVRRLIENYDRYKITLQRINLSNSALAQRQKSALKERFSMWVGEFLMEAPALQAMWLTLLRPDAHLT